MLPPAPALRLPRGALGWAEVVPSRVAAAVACQFSLAAAALLYLNRTLSGDVYFLLASGRHLVQRGFTDRNPFLTLTHGKVWHNQQWLAEWLFFQVHHAGGMALLGLVYALLLAAAFVPLTWMCRDRNPAFLLAAWAVSIGASVAVLDPRAGGFSLVLFTATIALVEAGRQRPIALIALPVVFAAWANLHGAFVAGLLFVAVAALASAIGRTARGRPTLRLRPALPLLAALAASGLALLTTPLGLGLIDYLRVYDRHIAPNRLPFEWQATYLHPPVMLLVVAFVALFAWLWRRAPARRPLEPLLTAAAFTLFALTATRQVLWLGPLAFYALHALGTKSSWMLSRRTSLPLAASGLALRVGWWSFASPAPDGPPQVAAAARYAAAHPPHRGRLLTPSGTGSYLMWRDRHRRVTIDGRLELYTARQVIANYRLLNGEGSFRYLRRWHISGVLTRSPAGVRTLRRHGFRVAAHRGPGWYLIRHAPQRRRARLAPLDAANAS